MFIIVLKYSANKSQSGQYLDGHKEWLKRGFEDGVFLLAGMIQPERGGGIIAHNTTLAELEARVGEDPFVAENIVSAEILEIAPGRIDERLAFLND